MIFHRSCTFFSGRPKRRFAPAETFFLLVRPNQIELQCIYVVRYVSLYSPGFEGTQVRVALALARTVNSMISGVKGPDRARRSIPAGRLYAVQAARNTSYPGIVFYQVEACIGHTCIYM